MIHIENNISLLHSNTFGIDVKARYFCRINTISQLQELIQWSQYREMPRLMLGGGSNILFTSDFPGLIIKMEVINAIRMPRKKNPVRIENLEQV